MIAEGICSIAETRAHGVWVPAQGRDDGMNDTLPHSRDINRPSFANNSAHKNQRAHATLWEGAGNAGCPRHPQPRVVVKNTRVSHHRYPGTPGIPCAMVLTVSFVLSPVIGFLATVTPRSLLLGSLTPAPRRQDHTTSPSASASFVWRAKSKLKRSFRMRGLQ
jgi:hypothetical protein